MPEGTPVDDYPNAPTLEELLNHDTADNVLPALHLFYANSGTTVWQDTLGLEIEDESLRPAEASELRDLARTILDRLLRHGLVTPQVIHDRLTECMRAICMDADAAVFGALRFTDGSMSGWPCR